MTQTPVAANAVEEVDDDEVGATQLLCVASILDVAHAALLSQQSAAVAGHGRDQTKHEVPAVRDAEDDVDDPLASLRRRDDGSRYVDLEVEAAPVRLLRDPPSGGHGPTTTMTTNAGPAAASAATAVLWRPICWVFLHFPHGHHDDDDDDNDE